MESFYFWYCCWKYRDRVRVSRIENNKREEKEAPKERQIRLLGGVRVKRREKNSCRRVEGVGPVTQLCTRGPLPLSARGGLISRPYRIRHDNRPNIHTNAVPGAPTVQRGPADEGGSGVLVMSKRSFSVLFLLHLAPLLVCCFLFILNLACLETFDCLSWNSNALPFQNKS